MSVGATNAGDNGGAAIYVQGGALSVSQSIFSGNHLSVAGGDSNGAGAIFMAGGGAPMTLSHDIFSGDSFVETNSGNADGGGAVYSLNDPVTVDSSTLSGESATVNGPVAGTLGSGGGALWTGAGVTANQSSINGNSLTVTAGNVQNGGGGLYNAAGPVSLNASTVAHNTVSLALHGLLTNGGGGVFNDNAGGFGGSAGAITVSNSTISDNAMSATGGSANEASGGGLYDFGGGGTITATTIAGNSTSSQTANTGGGGIYEKGTAGSLTLRNTIVSGNSVTGQPGLVGGRNCDFETPGTTIVSAGHNIEDGNSCPFSGPGDQPNTDPKLGPLAANGGPTQTRALLPGSPAIDRGDNAGCAATNQRGVSRPVPAGGTCDVGAYEYAPPVSVATFTTCTGALRASVTALPGSSPVALLVRVDNGGTRTVPTSGSPGTASLTLSPGRHSVEFWGESSGGDQELAHHRMSVVADTGAPTLTITSDQHKSTYPQNARASVTVRASALSGLLVDPSHRHLRISTRRTGRHTLTKVATSVCHRSTTRRFRYRVLGLFDQTFSLPSNRRCFSASRLTIRIHSPHGVRLRSVSITIGKASLLLASRTISHVVRFPRPSSGRFTLKIKATMKNGRHFSGSRRYSVCARR